MTARSTAAAMVPEGLDDLTGEDRNKVYRSCAWKLHPPVRAIRSVARFVLWNRRAL
jgi:hypothetical protein